jgi:hypothetical protein
VAEVRAVIVRFFRSSSVGQCRSGFQRRRSWRSGAGANAKTGGASDRPIPEAIPSCRPARRLGAALTAWDATPVSCGKV